MTAEVDLPRPTALVLSYYKQAHGLLCPCSNSSVPRNVALCSLPDGDPDYQKVLLLCPLPTQSRDSRCSMVTRCCVRGSGVLCAIQTDDCSSTRVEGWWFHCSCIAAAAVESFCFCY